MPGTGHFASGLVYGEHSFDARAAVIALALPGGDLGDQAFSGGDASIEALAARDREGFGEGGHGGMANTKLWSPLLTPGIEKRARNPDPFIS